MKPRSGALFVVAIAVAVAVSARETLAQVSLGKSDENAHQKLDITLSSTQGYDRNVTPDGDVTLGFAGSERAGPSTMVVGGASYAWMGRPVEVRATATSAMSYNRPLENTVFSSFRSVSHTGGLGASIRLPKRTTLLANQTAVYSPSSLYNLFPQPPATEPGAAPPATLDYAMMGFESSSYGSSLTVDHGFTQRSRMSVTADYQNTNTVTEIQGRRSLDSYGMRARFARNLTSNTASTFDYSYRSSEIDVIAGPTSGGILAEHGVNIGLDYHRRLSASRRLTLGASIGPSLAIGPVSAAPAPPVSESGASESAVSESAALEPADEAVSGNGRYRRLSVQASMDYEFARTWRASGIYRRGVDTVAGIVEPISGDRVTASLEGFLTRRMEVLVSAAYSTGESALNTDSAVFETYTGNVRLRGLMTRTFAAYAEYLYYFYDSRGSAPISPGMHPGLERKGIRAGLTLLVPVLRR